MTDRGPGASEPDILRRVLHPCIRRAGGPRSHLTAPRKGDDHRRVGAQAWPPLPFDFEVGQPHTAGCSRRRGSGGLTSAYGKSPDGRQGVRLNGCVAPARWCGAPVDSSENLDRPRRQRPRGHAVGQSNTDGLPDSSRRSGAGALAGVVFEGDAPRVRDSVLGAQVVNRICMFL
jgi:hypothetical protein